MVGRFALSQYGLGRRSRLPTGTPYVDMARVIEVFSDVDDVLFFLLIIFMFARIFLLVGRSRGHAVGFWIWRRLPDFRGMVMRCQIQVADNVLALDLDIHR